MEKIDKKILFAAWACNNKNYFPYQTWRTPLQKIFKEFIVFDPQECIYQYGKKEMNKKFLGVVEKEKPDFIYFWLIYDEFYIDTLLKIRKISPKTRTVNFFGDDDVMFENFSRYYALFIDYPLASHKLYFSKYGKEGIKNVFYSYGVNTDNFKPLSLEKKHDVTFIGTPMGDRPDFIRHLVKNGIKVRLYGAGWDKYPEFKEIYFGKPSPEEATEIINQSKINLSFTKNYDGKPGFKARVFEICACNSFILSEYFIGYLDFLKEDKELVMFKDENELLEKVKYFLKNEEKREKISEKAYKKTIENYSQENEFRKTFDKIAKLEKTNVGKGLPKIDKKVVHISIKELSEDNKNEVKNKVEEADYVGFYGEGSKISKHRDYFQMYSLEKTEKDISCCDYFVHSKWLGNYLSFYSGAGFKTLKKEDFFSLLSIDQLLVRKNYFLDNIEVFKDFKNRISEIFTEENTAFVSIPLIQVKGIKKINFEDMEKVFLPEFEDNLRALRYQKKLWYNAYPYKLALSSLFGNSVLRPWLKKSIGKMQVKKA